MLLSTLETLPLETLDAICTLLVSHDGSREAIACFSLVSFRCSAAAARYRLERVRLEVCDRRQINQLVGKLDHAFGQDGRAGYLRQMKLIGGMSTAQEDEEQINTPRLTTGNRHVRIREEDMHDDCYGMSKLPRSDGSVLGQESPGPVPSPEEKILIDEAWSPLIGFISGLHGMTDLVYACTDQVPRCLLWALHTYQPTTRLHVHNFSLRSLYQWSDQLHLIDPDEYTLLTSPSLYSIVATWFEVDKHGRVGFNDAAIYRMIMGLAPALRQANLFHGFLDAPGPATYGEHPRWEGFLGRDSGVSSSKGRLQALITNATSPDEIDAWLNRTDFGELHTLHLRAPTYSLCLQSIQKDAPLSKLRDLQLVFWRLHNDLDDELVLAQFLGGLPALECLDLEGYIVDDALEAIQQQHGNKLKRLRLIPHYPMSCDLVAMRMKGFPHLEQVALSLRRTLGDEREVAVYRSLAQLPLRRVQLHLDCDVESSEPGAAGQWINKFRNTLANTAVDQHLVSSVSRLLGEHIEYLKVDVQFSSPRRGRRLDREAYELLRWVGRGWVVKKNRKGGPPTVEQVGSRIESGSEKPGVADKLLRFDIAKRPDLRAAWTSVWPGEPGDRRQQWSSLPLASEAFTRP